jgi:hypothetical protein
MQRVLLRVSCACSRALPMPLRRRAALAATYRHTQVCRGRVSGRSDVRAVAKIRLVVLRKAPCGRADCSTEPSDQRTQPAQAQDERNAWHTNTESAAHRESMGQQRT